MPIRICAQASAFRRGAEGASGRGPAGRHAPRPRGRRRWPPRGCASFWLTVGPSLTTGCPFKCLSQSCPKLPVAVDLDRRSRGPAHDPNSAGAGHLIGGNGSGADHCRRTGLAAFEATTAVLPFLRAAHIGTPRTLSATPPDGPDAASAGLALYRPAISAAVGRRLQSQRAQPVTN